jgi:hypothetical protein
MKTISLRLAALMLALAATGTAVADHSFGVGVKAGTLGIGVEGTWRPLPYIDMRVGANQYDYSDNGVYGGVNYDAEISLDNYYVTGNVRFPLSPFRLTGGLYSNGNEFNAVSGDNGAIILIGGDPYPADAVGTLSASASFDSTSPYFGVGFDFTVFGKVGALAGIAAGFDGDRRAACRRPDVRSLARCRTRGTRERTQRLQGLAGCQPRLRIQLPLIRDGPASSR